MKLTRRQTFLGLLGVSSAASLGTYELTDASRSGETADRRREIDGLLAVADVVYHSDPEPFEPLVTAYVDRLNDDRSRTLRRTLSELDRVSYGEFGAPFRSLSREEGKRLFEVLGVNRVQSRHQGTLAERIRFHLVNSIWYVVLTTPKGTAQFGIENPVGHPGGFPSYERSL